MPTSQAVKHLTWKRGVAHYYRKIPKDLRFHYSKNGGQRAIMKSLKTRDPVVAVIARDRYHVKIEDHWAYLRAHGVGAVDPEAYYNRVQQAKQLGFEYMSMAQMLDAPIVERHRRLSFVSQQRNMQGSNIAREVAGAVLGDLEEPTILLSDVLKKYWKFAEDKISEKSEQQIRTWRHARVRAMRNLINVVGDIKFCDFKRAHALDFRDWWWTRVKAGEVKHGTANKDFENLVEVFQVVIDAFRLEKANEMRGIRLVSGERSKRKSLTRDQARDCLFVGNPLAKMKPELRAIVEICAELGTRPIEVINRAPEDIKLDHPIPHIKIRKNCYGKLKTSVSERDMPLIGAALRAYQKFPTGFPDYAGNSASCITAINKFLRTNNILPRGATLYSLRHAFEDRLNNEEAPPKVVKHLMGHSRGKVDYGDGPDHEQRLKWLNKVALCP